MDYSNAIMNSNKNHLGRDTTRRKNYLTKAFYLFYQIFLCTQLYQVKECFHLIKVTLLFAAQKDTTFCQIRS